MEKDKVAVIGFYVDKRILSLGSKEIINAYMSHETNTYGRILLALTDYLTTYSKKFDRVSLCITDQVNGAFPNGTLKGLMGMVNRSEIDIGVGSVVMHKVSTEVMDFPYPFPVA